MPSRLHASVTSLIFVLGGGQAVCAESRIVTQRDAQDYAMAACLIDQPSDDLPAQGFGLASIVIERSGTAPADWSRLDIAVKRDLARRPMVTIHRDGPVGSNTPIPIARCLDLLRAPSIVAEIRRPSTRPR